MHVLTALLLTFIPAVLATHPPLQCPKPRRFNGSPTCQAMIGNVSVDIFYVRMFERSPIARYATMDAFGRLRHAFDSVRKDRRRGFGLVNVEVGGTQLEIAQIFENDKIYDISKIKDLDLILALKIAADGLTGSASDTKKLIVAGNNVLC
uniref:Uncharacterized protein n=1 Tax=Romanomermis culicivorax TaxID=13658 RepID=A0A915K2G0_ROMCU